MTATLQHLTARGLVLLFEVPAAADAPVLDGLMIPWAQVSYLRLFHA